MWNEANRELFTECLDSLDKDPYVQLMRHVRQHTDGVTRYDHCLCVAYFSFTICRILGWDYRAAARGGLLHDLSPYSWEEEGSMVEPIPIRAPSFIVAPCMVTLCPTETSFPISTTDF